MYGILVSKANMYFKFKDILYKLTLLMFCIRLLLFHYKKLLPLATLWLTLAIVVGQQVLAHMLTLAYTVGYTVFQ